MPALDSILYLAGYEAKGWKITESDYREWLDRFDSEVGHYLDENYSPESYNEIMMQFGEDPKLGYNAVLDWLINRTDITYNFQKLLNYVRKIEVSNINVRGARRSGKSTTAFAIAYALRHEYNIVYVAPYVDVEVLPSWISWKPGILKLNKGDLGVADEMSLQANARRSMSRDSVNMFELLPVIAHTGAKLITITQLSSITDVNVVRWTNVDLCKGFATAAFGVENIERQGIIDPLDWFLKPRDNYVFKGSVEKGWSVVSIGGSKYSVYTELHDFMTDDLSRTYKGFFEKAKGDPVRAKELAMNALTIMIENDVPTLQIKSQLSTRGYDMTVDAIDRFRMKYIEEQLPAEFQEKKKSTKRFS